MSGFLHHQNTGFLHHPQKKRKKNDSQESCNSFCQGKVKTYLAMATCAALKTDNVSGETFPPGL